MVQHTGERISYKCDKHIAVPKSEWIIVENTHEALVSKEDFNYLKRFTAKGRSKHDSCLLDKLIYCQDCGEDLYINIKTNAGYCRNCHGIYFNYSKIENKVLTELTNNNLVNNDISRKQLFQIIDKIFVDKSKTFKIVFNNDIHDIISFKYLSRKNNTCIKAK